MVYASRSFTKAETQKEETLASTLACEHFSDYILEKLVEIEADHKPLMPILNSNIATSNSPLPSKIDAYWLLYIVHHVPWKSLNTADALSCALYHIP